VENERALYGGGIWTEVRNMGPLALKGEPAMAERPPLAATLKPRMLFDLGRVTRRATPEPSSWPDFLGPPRLPTTSG